MPIKNEIRKFSGCLEVGKVIRRLRLGRELSQGELAAQSHLSRSAVNSLENGRYQTISLEILQSVASTLGTSLRDILDQSELPESLPIKKGNEAQGEFVLDYPKEGFRIVSWLPRRKEFFLGHFSLTAKSEISNGILPHSNLLFFETFKGVMLVSFAHREVVLKEGEYLFFDGKGDYRLYNPDPLCEARGLLTAFPSFL